MNQRWRRYFGWSKSRAGLYHECLKKYSFQYVFKFEAGRTAKMVKVASKLATPAILKGNLIHTEIERFLKTRGRDEPAAAAAAHERLAAAYDRLRRDPAAQVSDATYGLVEAAELDATLAADAADADRQLAAFFAEHWPRYRDLEVVSFEELEKTRIGAHPAWVSADLVVREADGGLLLVDWKTGRSESPAAESVQLTGYIYWAHKKYGAPLDGVAAELVWLASGRVDRTARDPAQLAELEARVAADCETLLGLESYDQIEASPEARRCRRCNFLPLCREAAGFLEPGPRREAVARLRDRAR